MQQRPLRYSQLWILGSIVGLAMLMMPTSDVRRASPADGAIERASEAEFDLRPSEYFRVQRAYPHGEIRQAARLRGFEAFGRLRFRLRGTIQPVVNFSDLRVQHFGDGRASKSDGDEHESAGI